ncbi:unnamed protein product [Lactuca virosa]|uniref:RNase H type-1 domain-containing protein n=1 Tax=Lactuca virosa TaxID=75947 RepID=A0AAU9MD70_9ASTR|nr:unnamed protein product [Lactuca virosa]
MKLAALGRFLAKSAEKSLLFYQVVKSQVGKNGVAWSKEAGETLVKLKEHLRKLPNLASPIPNEPLVIYLSTSQEAISVVLVAEREKKQVPVYFVIKSLDYDGSGAGVVLESPIGERFTYALRFNFKCSNNEAEYEALLVGLQLAMSIDITKIKAYGDSMLVVNQVNGLYEAKDEHIKKYLAKVEEAIKKFDEFQIVRVPRSKNKEANTLSKLTSVVYHHLSKRLLVEILSKKSIEEKVEQLWELEEEDRSWIVPYIQYLQKGCLPSREKEAQKVRVNVANYIMYSGRLYQKGYSIPWLKCLGKKEAHQEVPDEGKGSN